MYTYMYVHMYTCMALIPPDKTVFTATLESGPLTVLAGITLIPGDSGIAESRKHGIEHNNLRPMSVNRNKESESNDLCDGATAKESEST